MKPSRTTLLAALLGILVAATAAAQGPKIGVFDPAKILSESRLGQDLQEELNRFRIEREGEIKKAKDDLKRLADQYKAGVDTMSPERRESIEADLTQRRRDLERMLRDAEADLNVRRQKSVRELERDVAAVIDEYGERNNYTLILQRDLCAYISGSIDITSDIVRLVDARQQR